MRNVLICPSHKLFGRRQIILIIPKPTMNCPVFTYVEWFHPIQRYPGELDHVELQVLLCFQIISGFGGIDISV